MEHIWRLLVAIFLVCIGTMLLSFAYVFQTGAIAAVAVWLSFGLILLGIGKGVFAIIDHHDEMKGKDKE